MTYKEATEFLFIQTPMFQNTGAHAYKPGLSTTLRLAEAWGNPQDCLRTVHVAGTNGKGSTAHTIASVLQAAGYRTGLYTSPHLVDFRERIRVDGVPVDEEYVCSFVEKFIADDSLRALQPSFFELTTIMALRYFADCKVDVAVIEVGLGGRLDCTNIINPELCVITNISMDHTALLGNTPEEIAAEKAGIIKPGTPVVFSEAEGGVRKVFEETAIEKGAPYVFACDSPMPHLRLGDDGLMHYSGTRWGDIDSPLTGDCQRYNTRGILAALDILEQKFTGINAEAVRKGFAEVCSSTGLAGRWSVMQTEPFRIICDTGHNPGAWDYLGPTLSAIEADTLHVVIGFVNDKDLSHILPSLPANAHYYFATPSVNRGRDASETAVAAKEYGLSGGCYATVKEAARAACENAKAGDTVFIGGSTFVVADYLSSK
ncbi:MAG: bifunctional folylpolyglutamate synthase/dihydrofolate synthase [Muribaculaceae bacterium]|nr:bifunctional folylpolyglutamate synthase/dihydrofolate synthase [Muribaculaceae bacterium]